MTEDKLWQTFPFLRALQPGFGECVEAAFLGTYSVDLVVVVAAMLALTGIDNDRGSGSKVDFANSFERLRGKFRVVCQRGRILAPARNLVVLKLLDHFVREIDADEQKAAWHPKTALVRCRGENGAVSWRLWLGSRNLTKSTAWELGLLLVSSESDGQMVQGVGTVGELLAQYSGLDGWEPGRLRKELDRQRWLVPRGLSVEEIGLWRVGEKRPFLQDPGDLRRLVIISPYLDGSVVGELGTWGGPGTQRILVSTLPELKKLSLQAKRPLESFDGGLRFLPSPLEEEPDPDSNSSQAESEDEEPENRGLHAKLIYAESRSGKTVWVGSANATQRAWFGPNAEIVARLAVGAEVVKGLDAFLDGQTREVHGGLLESATPPDPEQERLDSVRMNLVATWNLRQEQTVEGSWLCGEVDPYTLAPNMELKVARQGDPLLPWPAGFTKVILPDAGITGETELIAVWLKLWNKQCRWLQVAPIAQFQTEERDRRIVAQYLGARSFLSWIRSLLDESMISEGGSDWDDGGSNRRYSVRPVQADLWTPSLEQVLKTWTRDPEQLSRVDKVLAHYLESVQQQQEQSGSEESRALEALRKLWPVIRHELVVKRRRGFEQVS